jgi:prepilin-type N-terminal cleavage/methylation domain-containing protein
MRRSKLQLKRNLASEVGMTLLELLVVMAVLGILAAIATQQFMLYRSRAMDLQMKSDLKNAAVAMESYYAEFQSYAGTVAAIQLVGYRKTADVTLTINLTSPSSFTLTASKPTGSQPSFSFNSTTGLID